ncbi:hypothetical protein A9Q86_15050 [Flavobacteriales bacterium 33_180_T64]|nr:hypothetical protein A9Q86_15050 [Flavobacteriales bacterium 33_180_T64]
MHFKHTYISLLSLILLSSFSVVQQNEIAIDIKLLSTQTYFEVGHTISLEFSISEDAKPLLYCTNSYGSTLISPSFENNILNYKIPQNISSKSGTVSWKLQHNDTSISGQLIITPKLEAEIMETYIGPPSIEAGGSDYTMLVVIPTDSLDNPLPENTVVNAKYQFLKTETENVIRTKNLIAYQNIYSHKESGRMLVSSENLHTNSKEFTIIVYPAIPTNFSISAKQPHDYADGNQITIFKTSVIKDKQDNIVVDGTYVDFFITNEKGNVLRTSGTTINGVAISKMIHPDYKTKWSIKAYVNGISESDTITLNYKQVIDDFIVTFSKSNRTITIGPLQSFMKQMIPNGLHVKLLVYKNNIVVDTKVKTTVDGYVHFNLKPDILKNDNYDLSIKTAGLEKTFKSITLW